MGIRQDDGTETPIRLQLLAHPPGGFQTGHRSPNGEAAPAGFPVNEKDTKWAE